MLFLSFFYFLTISKTFKSTKSDCTHLDSIRYINSTDFSNELCVIISNSFFDFTIDVETGAILYHPSDGRGELYVQQTKFMSCRAYDSVGATGGGISAVCSLLNIWNTLFQQCSASYQGQAIYLSPISLDATACSINYTKIVECAEKNEFEYPFYSIYLNRANSFISNLNSSENCVTEYGASLGILDAQSLDMNFCNVYKNEGRNIVHLTSSLPFALTISTTNFVENIPLDPAVIMFCGDWALTTCVFIHTKGPLYSFDWEREGTLLIKNSTFSTRISDSDYVTIELSYIKSYPQTYAIGEPYNLTII